MTTLIDCEAALRAFVEAVRTAFAKHAGREIGAVLNDQDVVLARHQLNVVEFEYARSLS